MRFRNKFMTWMLSATMVVSMTAPVVYAGEDLLTSEVLDEDVVSEEVVEESSKALESADHTRSTVELERHITTGPSLGIDGLERNITTGPSLDIDGIVKETYDVSVRQNLIGGSITIEGNLDSAKAGETIVFTANEESGYEVTSVAWWTVDEAGNKVGDLNKITANEDGKYTFEMPESDIRIGAVFQDALQLVGNKICEDGIKDKELTTYAAFGSSCLNADETEAWIRLQLDDRFFNEYKDMDDLIFTFELRQHKDKKYKVAGSQQYTIAELEAASVDNGDGTRDLKLFVDTASGKSLEADYQAYCYMTVTRDCWVDETGEPVYYKKNTSVDAKIIEAGKEKLVPTVFLYNLSANTFSGMLLREFLAGQGITFRDITNENLNQNLGYMAGWNGYEAVSDEEAYSPDTYDFSYLLYCNVSEVQVDAIMEARRQDNIKINYRSVLTEWGAKQSFAEMTKRIQKEDSAFKAALKLGVLMTEVRNLDASVYGAHPDWNTLQASLAHAIEVFSQEGEGEFYDEAYQRLLKDYLVVTEKLQMEGKLEILLEDNQDGTYTASTKIHPKEGEEEVKDYTFDYVWHDGTSEPTITVKKEELYKIHVYLDGRDDTHGFLYATLAVPSAPQFTTHVAETSVSVEVQEVDEVINMPEVENYDVELYKDGVLVEEQSQEVAGTFIFDGLEKETTYTVKVKAINPVGYSQILESTVITKANSSTNDSDDDSSDDDSDNHSAPTTNKNNTVTDAKQESIAITTNVDQADQVKIDVVLNKEVVSEIENGVVTLDMPAIMVESHKDNATTLKIKNATKEAIVVEVPVANGTVGTVVVSVNADGTETIIRDIVVKDGKVLIPVEDEIVIKLVDNSKAFEDVSQEDWYSEAVTFVSSHELFNGTAETTFAPHTTMTRGMLAMVLHNLAHNPESVEENHLSDVGLAYYTDAVKWAVSEGIIYGYDDDTFKPNHDITREQLATMLYRFANNPSVNESKLDFVDTNKVSAYATSAIQWAVANGMMNGKTNHILDPQGKVTRSEVATMLMRFCMSEKRFADKK